MPNSTQSLKSLGYTSSLQVDIRNVLPLANKDSSRPGMDVINYFISNVGVGSTNANFASKILSLSKPYSSERTYNACQALHELGLILGQITINTSLDVRNSGRTTDPFFTITATWTYNGTKINKTAVIPAQEYISTPFELPLPSPCSNDVGSCCESISTKTVSVVITSQKTPQQILTQLNAQRVSNGTFPVIMNLYADETIIKTDFTAYGYQAVINDLTNRTTAFTPRNGIFSNGGGNGMMYIPRLVGAFTASFSYTKNNLSKKPLVNRVSTLTTSLKSTLGSALVKIDR